MADEVVRRIGRDLMFRALESPDADAYLRGLTDGLAAASQLIYHRVAGSDLRIPTAIDEQRPLSSLDELDQLLADAQRPGRRVRARRIADRVLAAPPDPPVHDEDIDTQANWLAALAIGLVHDHEPSDEDVRDLAATSRDNPVALRAAATKVEMLPRLDATSRESASELLRKAERTQSER